MKRDTRTPSLYVFDDFGTSDAFERRAYRALIIRRLDTPHLGGFNARNVDELLNMARILGLPVRLGAFTDDATGELMRLELARALGPRGPRS